MQEDTSFRGDVMDSTLMPINKGKTGEDRGRHQRGLSLLKPYYSRDA